MISRQTAKKVRIWDIVNGEWVKKGGTEPNYIKTRYGEIVARVRILATIVGKFVSKDKKFGSLTLDDGTDTVRIKFFKELEPMENLKIGDLIDVIGKIREYKGEIYIMPEIVRKVEDPNFELLRKLEIIYKLKGLKKTKELIEKHKSEFKDDESLKKFLVEKHKLEPFWVDTFLSEKIEDKSERIRLEILKLLENNKGGMTYSDIIAKLKLKEAEVEPIINELLNEGVCYEPTPGKIKKI
jgi:RPA family protein